MEQFITPKTDNYEKFSNFKRLIITDLNPNIVDEEEFKNWLKGEMPELQLNIFYDVKRHLSILLYYCPERKLLEVSGHLSTFSVGEDILSFSKQIAPSSRSSVSLVKQWIRQVDADYLNSKPESYNVF